MKIITKSILLPVFLFAAVLCNGQTWMKNVKKENPTFYDIQKAFYDSNKDKKEIKKKKALEDGDYEKFKRWEWYWGQRVGKSGEFPASDILWKEFKKYNDAHSNKSMQAVTSNANWTFKGATTSTGGYAGIGRINCIAFHPTIAQTFWVGCPAGGLWKTTDGGTTWSTNTDNNPVLGVSDIAINPSNPSIMYIATGDGDGGGDTKSVGVLKSIDGGASWNTTGLNWTLSSQKVIRRLIINPTNPLILLAAASDGIWRTANGGTTWTKQKTGWFIDMEFKPADPNFVYASTYDYNSNAQIFTSTDAGISWTQVTSFTGYDRVSIAVSANNAATVNAVCSNSSDEGLGGLWSSTDSGASFTQYYTGTCSNNLLNSSFDASACGGQGWYDLAYAVNPADANEIWLGGVNTWRSTDGGANWNLNDIWTGSQTTTVPEVHADKHFIAYNPLNNNVYECNDGGLYVTSNAGTTWTDITNGMAISEIYRISTSATIADIVICGLQDNGSKELYAGSWYDVTGGDGMECIIDYTNVNIQYATYVKGQISKTTDSWSSSNIIVNNGGTAGTVDEDGAWVTPYIINPMSPNILLVGKSQVYQTLDTGATWAQLGTINGITGNILSMAYAPSNTNTIYAASSTELFQTTDGGTTWNLIRTSTDAITYIAVDPANPQKIFVTNSGYTGGSKVWTSPDGGATWTNISGTLPNVPANCIVYQNGSNAGLYIGTDLGVYYRDGSMTDWITYNTGLPNVVVSELEISYINNKLWAGTFGRGLWNSDLYSSVTTGIANSNVSPDFTVYPNPSNGKFILQNSSASTSKPVDISIYNALGKRVWEEKQSTAAQRTIDLSHETAGVYFVHFTTDNKTTVKKIEVTK